MLQRGLLPLALVVFAQTAQAQFESVAPTTTQISSSGNGTGNCWSYPPIVGNDTVTGRSIAGRIMLDDIIEEDHLQKRFLNTKKPITKLGTCTLNGPAGSMVSPEPYPGPGDLEEYAGAIYWYFPLQTSNPGSCSTLTLSSVPNAAAFANKVFPPMKTPYVVGGRGSSVNVDQSVSSLQKDCQH